MAIIFERVYDRFPRPFPQDRRSIFYRWWDAHQQDLDIRDERLEYVKKSRQISHAVGKDLELKGDRYGKLGERNGRGDDVYRRYLSGLVKAFTGLGTRSDIQVAVAAGVNTTKYNVELTEDVTTLQYGIILHDWQTHTTNLVDELCEFADAAGVERTGTFGYVIPDTVIEIDAHPTEKDIEVGLPPVDFEIVPGETTVEILSDDGFGSGFFGSGDVFGPGDQPDTGYDRVYDKDYDNSA